MWAAQVKIRRAKDLFKHRKKSIKNIRSISQIRIQYGGELFACPELQSEGGKLIAAVTEIRKGENEKNAFEHGLGSRGPVGLGTGLGDDHYNDHN
jgi:hypothetical protein